MHFSSPSLIAHRSPLTAHRSPLTAHRSPLSSSAGALVVALALSACTSNARVGAGFDEPVALVTGDARKEPVSTALVLADSTTTRAGLEAPLMRRSIASSLSSSHVVESPLSLDATPAARRHTRLGWQDASSATSRNAATAILPLVIENLRGEHALATLTARIEVDGKAVSAFLGQVDLEAKQQVLVEVDLRALSPVTLESQQFAASVSATAETLFDSGALESSITTTLYYHVEDSDLLVYDELALSEVFSAGDFRSRDAGAARRSLVRRLPGGSVTAPAAILGRVTIARLMTDDELRSVLRSQRNHEAH